MTCKGERLAWFLKWKVFRPFPLMSTVPLLQVASTTLEEPSVFPQFSIRTMLVSVAGTAVALAALIEFGTFGLALTVLAIGLLLRSRNRRLNHRTRTAWAMILPATLWCFVCFVGWALFGYGPVISKQSWPHELTRMIDVVDGDAKRVRVSGLGAFIDTEHVWRMQMNRTDMPKLALEFGMNQATRNVVPDEFWRAFPGWWRPAPGKDTIYLSTPNFPSPQRGPDGYHFLAAYDPGTKQLYVWHKFNF